MVLELLEVVLELLELVLGLLELVLELLELVLSLSLSYLNVFLNSAVGVQQHLGWANYKDYAKVETSSGSF